MWNLSFSSSRLSGDLLVQPGEPIPLIVTLLNEGITNGKAESLKDIEKSLADVLEQINLAAPIGISSKITNMRTSVAGPSGLAATTQSTT